MHFSSASRTVLCLLLCAAPAALLAGPVLEPGAANAAAAGPHVDEFLARIGQAAANGSGAGLVGLADSIAARTDLHPAARDRLLRELALALAQVAPDAAARGLVTDLERRPPGVRVWLHEGHHRIDVLLYDVAAAARYTSRRWAEEAAREQARFALQTADTGLVDRFAAGDDTFRRGVVAALDEVSSADLLMFRDRVATALGDGVAVTALALPIALRLQDRGLAATLMQHGHPALIVHALPLISAALAPADALAVLESALSQPGLASSALFEMGRLATAEPRARDRLFAALADPDLGGSAAAALAGLDDAEIAWELGRRLESGASGLPERRALLALRLSHTDAARVALDRFMRSPDASARLQRELAAGSAP